MNQKFDLEEQAKFQFYLLVSETFRTEKINKKSLKILYAFQLD